MTTKLKNLFAKPIDRHIEGVIKADVTDDAALTNELDEYVLTDALARHLATFLETYNGPPAGNGVWISGFFGSGKSHLLKMLALLLQNKAVGERAVLDWFLEKCPADNALLLADLKKAANTPSKSILFNIDSKADIVRKTSTDALLSVFVRVFDEECGYYGRQGYIAEFERQLDGRGQLEAFCERYAAIAGKPWARGREEAQLEGDNIDRAYGEATGAAPDGARGILDKYREDYRVSIEDFAERINAYILAQPDKRFRLNFFVDEVGQFVADNAKLMLNLQTIAENLASKCRGRAWLVVTAQEAIGEVVGRLGGAQGNDFTKIRARFATHLTLDSANVAEVIQKRLLAKTPAARAPLAALYAAQQDNFGTLFDFVSGATRYDTYADEAHFIAAYPMVPYQFDLFQNAIKSLSEHNAFLGRFQSVGERSLLAVFQQVVCALADDKTASADGADEAGKLATFDMMFDGIRPHLQAQTTRAIIQAEGQRGQLGDFCARVLKALYLVKYIRGFNATAQNVQTLLIPKFGCDMQQLEQDTRQALDTLERQAYVQRHGDSYEYLTNEEQDVESEIQNTEVDYDEARKKLASVVFDGILRAGKIKHEANGQDFSFTRKLDDIALGREHELAIRIISPLHDDSGNRQRIVETSAFANADLVVWMPADERLVSDLRLFVQTEKYAMQNASGNQSDVRRGILKTKAEQNYRRERDIALRARDLLGAATLFIGGNQQEVGATEAKTRLEKGFGHLVENVYPHLRMLNGKLHAEADIAEFLQLRELGEPSELSEAEHEVLRFLRVNSRASARSAADKIVRHFECAPYGWHHVNTLCIVAQLCGKGKLELRQNGEPLALSPAAAALRNTREHAHLIVEFAPDFSPEQLRAARDFLREFFSVTDAPAEARPLAERLKNDLLQEAEKWEERAKQTRYPFAPALAPLAAALRQAADWPTNEYIEKFAAAEELRADLLRQKRDTADPIEAFWNGAQRTIFDQAADYQTAQRANFSYAQGDAAARIAALLERPDCYAGTCMRDIKQAQEELQQQVQALVQTERDSACQKLQTLQQGLQNMPQFAALPAPRAAAINREIAALQEEIRTEALIPVLRDKLLRFEHERHAQILAELLAAPESGKGESGEETKPAPPAIISLQTVEVDYAKPLLQSEEDLEAYLSALRRALLTHLAQNRQIKP